MLEWLCLPHFLLASLLDARTRIVPNALWFHLILIGVPVLIVAPTNAATMLISVPLGASLWKAGLGGADAKATMVLGLYLGPLALLVTVALGLAGGLGAKIGGSRRTPLIPFLTLGLLSVLAWSTWATLHPLA